MYRHVHKLQQITFTKEVPNYTVNRPGCKQQNQHLSASTSTRFVMAGEERRWERLGGDQGGCRMLQEVDSFVSTTNTVYPASPNSIHRLSNPKQKWHRVAYLKIAFHSLFYAVTLEFRVESRNHFVNSQKYNWLHEWPKKSTTHCNTYTSHNFGCTRRVVRESKRLMSHFTSSNSLLNSRHIHTHKLHQILLFYRKK